MKVLTAVIFALVVFAIGGCEQPAALVPVNVEQYGLMQKDGQSSYLETTVLMHNVQRYCDDDLPAQQRLDSLRLVQRLGESSDDVRREVSEVLRDSRTSAQFVQQSVDVLLATNDSAWAHQFAHALAGTAAGSPFGEKVVAWLCKHPGPGTLGAVAKAWSTQSPTGPGERLFIELTEKLGSKEWDQVMLQALNTHSFADASAAYKVLLDRLGRPALSERILKMTPACEQFGILQDLLKRFDYLPESAAKYESAMAIAKRQPLDAVLKAFRVWRDDDYALEPNDLALLAGLGGDSSRPLPKRAQLVEQLTKTLSALEHVRMPSAASQPAAGDSFAANHGRLSQGDLWTIYLVQEMLSRPRTQAGLMKVAQKDREDTNSAWGGLIMYRSGVADAMLYPAADGPANDETYVPNARFEEDSIDAICRFCTRFEKAENSLRAGPNTQELQAARRSGMRGLIITSVSSSTFCVHFYNDQGVVISLGAYPFAELN